MNARVKNPVSNQYRTVSSPKQSCRFRAADVPKMFLQCRICFAVNLQMRRKLPKPFRPGETIAPQFTPVPMRHGRRDRWTAEEQRLFIMALSVTGQVEAACKMSRVSVKSALEMRNRPDARNFALAWDVAILSGRAHLIDHIFDRLVLGIAPLGSRASYDPKTGDEAYKILLASLFMQPSESADRFEDVQRPRLMAAAKGDIR